MPYNHTIRQAKQILHNHTDNTGNNGITRTVPHTSHSDYTQNQPQTATHTKKNTLSYTNMVRYGRELDISQTKTTQTTPKQKQVNTTQTSTDRTPCREQAQAVTTQHTTVGMQTDDTPLASNATLTATVDDIIEQIPGKQEGG